MSRALVGIRPTPVDVPPDVRALAGWAVVTPVWRNEMGGLTFRLDEPGSSSRRPARYLKWVPHGTACPHPLDEARRLEWARRHAVVPRVLDVGTSRSAGWIVTEAIEATSAIEARWVAEREHAARVIGVGLRLLHDALPVGTCPYTWSAGDRLASLPPHLPRPLRALLQAVPDVDRLVVCHGDPCVPNTLLADDGTFAGHVDLGELGVADRWADLAVATRSVTRRYGPGLEPVVLDAYGVAPDPERSAYYRRLWDAVENHRLRGADRKRFRRPAPA
ncbi:aminoglycoside 3'-phosphotransferase [Antribacter gilvus]|uniref:aminoglycoside 3'-phosphotransferase n=1 Tax=Antribacter gilvus TaxID=2304675 RepID=UPI001F0BB470|nr:aminoglycoside 3'-phosphotransferase [Antribacter gilvus]